MKTLLSLTGAAAVAALAVAFPVKAANNLNSAPPGASAQRAAPGDRGMAIMSAVVNPDGTLARGEGVVSSGPGGGTASYEVIFGRDVTACAYSVNIGSGAASGTVPTGQTMVIGRGGNPAGIFVQTFDSAGAATTSGFHVIVYCGR